MSEGVLYVGDRQVALIMAITDLEQQVYFSLARSSYGVLNTLRKLVHRHPVVLVCVVGFEDLLKRWSTLVFDGILHPAEHCGRVDAL